MMWKLWTTVHIFHEKYFFFYITHYNGKKVGLDVFNNICRIIYNQDIGVILLLTKRKYFCLRACTF